jgi:hypothetical protein
MCLTEYMMLERKLCYGQLEKMYFNATITANDIYLDPLSLEDLVDLLTGALLLF